MHFSFGRGRKILIYTKSKQETLRQFTARGKTRILASKLASDIYKIDKKTKEELFEILTKHKIPILALVSKEQLTKDNVFIMMGLTNYKKEGIRIEITEQILNELELDEIKTIGVSDK